MYKLTITFLLCTFLSFSFAQTLTKDEKKELLKEIKELKKSPEKYKFIKESCDVKDIIIIEQNNEITGLKKDIQKKDLRVKNLTDSLTIAEAKTTYTPSTVVSNGPDNSGYNYRVQIGLFSKLDLSSTLNSAKFFVYENKDGKHIYSVGNFKTLEEAEVFKDHIRRMGIKDAFVSEYQDGNRVK